MASVFLSNKISFEAAIAIDYLYFHPTYHTYPDRFYSSTDCLGKEV